ncbi:MAG: anthranilate phosphoribosyltransferase [Longimicrobiales bacterium]
MDQSESHGPELTELLARLVRGEHLDTDDAEHAFRAIMEGRASPVLAAALLVALRAKREMPTEVAGGVRALRAAMVPVSADRPHDLVDTCGTGGGAVTTFNISTAAALLAAGAGVRIAKHGNRSFTSRCGSADVLAELGVIIELTPAAMAEVLTEAGIVFMFAPLLHPAMRHVAPVRRELGIATVMNVLGPLTNPAGARRQVVGVADPGLLELIAGGLHELAHKHALVVHGEPGIDEFSPIGATDVIELHNGEVKRFRVTPEQLLGSRPGDADGLRGGTPDYNARIVTGVLDGSIKGAARAAVVLNAAAAIYIGEKAGSLEAAVAVAQDALDAGAGIAALERLRAATGKAASRHAG